jgi:hypothetical protein
VGLVEGCSGLGYAILVDSFVSSFVSFLPSSCDLHRTLHTFPSLHIALEGLLVVLLTSEMLVALAVSLRCIFLLPSVLGSLELCFLLDKPPKIVIEGFFVLLEALEVIGCG